MTGGRSVSELVDGLAAELPGVERVREGDATTFARGGVVFAVLDADGASFRLRPDIVRGALATPDTTHSQRGPDWVRFAPSELDTFAADRAEAWFRFADRRARDPGQGRPPVH